MTIRFTIKNTKRVNTLINYFHDYARAVKFLNIVIACDKDTRRIVKYLDIMIPFSNMLKYNR